MSWLESKYIGILSTRLRNFKRKSGDLYNFSCPICGDSSKDLRKSRGFIYLKAGEYRYTCHNSCGTMKIDKFIKLVDEGVYHDYKLERLLDNKGPELPKKDPVLDPSKPKYVTTSALKELKKVSQLKHDHFARRYIDGRQIPSSMHHRLFYAPKFMEWTNGVVPGKFDVKALRHDGPALVIPFVNKDDRLHAFQGRYFEGDVRYITIVTDESVPKIWGLDRYDRGNRGYVLEGPIDAMFLPNAVATAGGTEISTLRYLNSDNIIVCFDNEPRSKDTVKKIDKSIRAGYKVCIWPDGLHHKDVNDMIKDGGMKPDQVRDLIDMNTYSGLRATLRLNDWKKV